MNISNSSLGVREREFFCSGFGRWRERVMRGDKEREWREEKERSSVRGRGREGEDFFYFILG